MNSLLKTMLMILLSSTITSAQVKIETGNMVKGFCIAAPSPSKLNQFILFIENDLVPAGINTLVLRVDYNYQFASYPELSDENALSKNDVKQLVKICKKHHIEIIPQINLLGHQSWASSPGNLLKIFPEFDETPNVKFPEKYEWPNPDGLYCKSYCPLHPKVHEVVFSLIDEITAAFEANAFHAGLDEVFYIGHEQCPRCANLNKAQLFSDEVNRIQVHLKNNGKNLWMWGDRLIDGSSTGIGMWEGSENGTWPAIDLISKDVVICDWHYDQAIPTASYFALKGFKVISCPWRKGEVAQLQWQQMKQNNENSTQPLQNKFGGVMQTVWSSAERFLDSYNNPEPEKETEAACFKQLIEAWKSDKK